MSTFITKRFSFFLKQKIKDILIRYIIGNNDVSHSLHVFVNFYNNKEWSNEKLVVMP